MWQVVAASQASAYEDRLSLAIGLGYAHATLRQLPHPGAAVGVEASLGLSNTWSVRGGVSYGFHPGQPALSQFAVQAELLYLVDVFEVVPYAGLGVDGLGTWTSREGGLNAAFGVHPVFGADWLLDREFALGLLARPVFVLSDWQNQPLAAQVLLSAIWLFDQ